MAIEYNNMKKFYFPEKYVLRTYELKTYKRLQEAMRKCFNQNIYIIVNFHQPDINPTVRVLDCPHSLNRE